ncbi:hypothetical protein AAFF_G00420990 [Aldrovandia affinis]|uniref:RNB domain-containing protein n=1 Tax=Aldrovandia affinis TaxID=143900 RepID=A0AAD7SC04_9TELE|nr:hypothetical protein AAFF_G00420990 [Aldrovandia affinis]
MMIVPAQKLYASVPLSHALTPHNPEGQLLKRAVGSALVAPSPSADNQVYEALVLHDVSSEDRIYLQLSRRCCSNLGLRKGTTCAMDVQFQLNRLQFCKWHQAVDLFPDVERVLPDLSLGCVPECSGDFPNLNAKQKAAIALIIGEVSEDLSTAPLLIYGPFGTGKTFILATAVKELLRQPGTRVLICTHTNSSADLYVKDHFHQYVESGHPEARPLRIKANKKVCALGATDNITLCYCLISHDYQSFLIPKRSDLDSHRVVITTTMMARHLHDLKLPVGYFTHILIDEASQMLECAALMPLGLAGMETRIVLAGDHMQMGPKLFSVVEGSSSDHTLLTRLFHYYQRQEGEVASSSRVILNENYRCTKEIVDFVTAHFYVGKSDVIKASGKVPPHPRFHPLRFHHIRGTCRWDKESMSWFNSEEVTSVIEIVEELLKEWPPEWGMQFRAILMTAVHTRNSLLSSETAYPELFGDTRFLNTAITRAQSQVVAIGDAPALCYFGKCSKIWKSYIKLCIDKGSATPQHLTMGHIEQEVKEISKFHKAEEGYDSDFELSKSDMGEIEDPILMELLDESKDVQVIITKEGLLEIIQKAILGDPTEIRRRLADVPHRPDWCDPDIHQRLKTHPNDFKRCELIMEKFDSGYAIPLDQPTLRININGRENVGRSFPGDLVAVEILSGEDCSCNGKVVGVLNREPRSAVFVCAIDKYNPQVMTPINKCVSKIFTPFAKKWPNSVAVWKQVTESGHWIPQAHIKINEDSRQNQLFVVEVLKWVKSWRRHRVSGNWRHVQPDEGVHQGKGMAHDMVKELMIMYNSFVSDFLITNVETRSLTPLKCQDSPDPKEVCQFITKHSALTPFSVHLSHLQDENTDLSSDDSEGQSADGRTFDSEESKADRDIRGDAAQRHGLDRFSVFTSLFKGLETAAQNRDFYTMLYLITADDIHPQLQPVAAEFRRLCQKAYIHRSNSTPQSKVGHHDLQLDSYTWASSPMRRYMDIIVQRLLHSVLEKISARDSLREHAIANLPRANNLVKNIAMGKTTFDTKQLLKLKGVKPLRIYSDQIEMLEFPYPGSDLKVCRKSLREVKPNKALSSITMRYLIRKKDPLHPFSNEIRSFDDRIKGEEDLTHDEIASYRKLLKAARQHELLRHDVVLCTCSSASDPNFLKTMNFRQILIDECAMATEPESMIPLVAHKPEQIVLLGDHKQLQPIVHSDLANKLGMKKSLFERYMNKPLEVRRLDTQYRMHERICEFPSETFYNSSLKTEAKPKPSALLSPSKEQTPILFGHVDGQEVTLIVSTEKGNENSTVNVEEAEQAVRVARLLISVSGIEPTSIAILAPYNAQVSKINDILSERGIKEVAVCTITKSQGSEWRYVILSTVRSCPSSEIDAQGPKPTKAWLSKKLGFVTDPNQVNVGITRAQDGLCIIGTLPHFHVGDAQIFPEHIF